MDRLASGESVEKALTVTQPGVLAYPGRQHTAAHLRKLGLVRRRRKASQWLNVAA